MDITWHGYSCFTIKSKDASVIINPYNENLGLKIPKLKGDITIITGSVEGNDNIKAVSGDPYLIDWPGEYEVNEVAVTCFAAPEGKGFFFNLIGNGLKICFIEKAGKELSDELIDKIGDVDVLLVGVGGNEVCSAEEAHKIIEEIEPRAVIPMHYAIKGASQKLNELEPFLKLAGVSEPEVQDKFILGSKSQLKEDQTEYFILNPQTA